MSASLKHNDNLQKDVFSILQFCAGIKTIQPLITHKLIQKNLKFFPVIFLQFSSLSLQYVRENRCAGTADILRHADLRAIHLRCAAFAA
jgi:hypothetical protein